MYLGGNGFFWVTSYDDRSTDVIEVRRGYAAQRNWTSHPGEVHHSTTGEPGGAWMHLGRPPHSLVGVGLCAVGWDEGSGFTRSTRSYQADVSALFDGIDEDVIGDFGLVLGGAAGDELDSADLRLGTPPQAVVLMSSRHTDKYLPTLDAQMGIEPGIGGSANPQVRADVVLIDSGDGGGVLSVGSINWAGSLAWNGYENDVATFTTNVLRHFLAPPP
jgi:N,N-dimethylformamidase